MYAFNSGAPVAAKEIIVAITGASGGPYALRLLDCLDRAGVRTHVICSPMVKQLLIDECKLNTLDVQGLLGRQSDHLTVYNYRDVGCALASGSYRTHGMVICPTSSNTLGAIASGLGDNLITRAAHVYLMPNSVSDLIDFVVGKMLDLLDVPHELNTRWTGREQQRGQE